MPVRRACTAPPVGMMSTPTPVNVSLVTLVFTAMSVCMQSANVPLPKQMDNKTNYIYGKKCKFAGYFPYI